MHRDLGTVHPRAFNHPQVRGRTALLTALALALIGASCLWLSSAPGAGARSASKKPSSYALIDVTVASLWTKPTDPRKIDAPSLGNPVRLAAWLDPLDTAQRVWLTGHLIDQGLYGQTVAIWKRRGKWDKISLTGQATRTGLSYPGWVPARQLTAPTPVTPAPTPTPTTTTTTTPTTTTTTTTPEAVVAVPKTWLYQQTSTGQRGPRLLHLSFNTRLPELGHAGRYTIVQTPGNTPALIASNAVVTRDPAAPVPSPTTRQIVNTAKRFLGLKYLWAGTSAYGFDCSGFTYTLYDFYGIVLPRVSEDQVKVGRKVRRKALRPGDLVFFATEPPSKDVSHVAMYVGGGDIIHSPHSGAAVQIIPLSRLLPYYVGARRYLARQGAPSTG